MPLAGRREACDTAAMLNILSIFIGLIALILAIPAFIPLLGWANWIIIPIAIVGLALGAMSSSNAGRNLNIRSEEHTSELPSLMRNSYAVFCLKKKTNNNHI